MLYEDNTNFFPGVNIVKYLPFLIYFFIIILYENLKYFFLYPKNYQNIKSEPVKLKNNIIDRDRYHLKKIPNNIDTIIIGSGIGGLSCGAFLSKVGKKVLVLEQHYIAGGCMHSFEYKGIEHETGIHYIGKINKRKNILDLITDSPMEWCKMGEKTDGVYDEIYINNNKYLFRAGEQNFIDELSIKFPEEKNNIIKYIKLVKKVASKDLFFNLKIIKSSILQYLLKLYLKYWDKDYYKYLNISTYNVLSQFTNNEELKSVLAGQFGDYGIPPKKSNFFIHASIVNHYLEGGYYPKGGPGIIAKKIIPVIENSGGRVLVGKGVKEILIENNKAIGVEMSNGNKIYSKNIVSAVGLNNTFNKLVNHKFGEYYQKIIESIPCSTGFVYCFLNLNGTSEELELRQSNLWIYPNKNFDKLMENFYDDIENNEMPIFISSSSAKDSSWNIRYPNKSSIILLTPAKKEYFNRWENEKCTNRNLDYKDLKELLANKMLSILYKYYPKTKGKVFNYTVGTPLTNQHYLGYINGEGYGLESTSKRYSCFDLKPETNIKNLYLTGQDICTLGFTGALMGGLLTAHSILGYGTLIDILIDRNLIKDILRMEKIL